MTTPLYYIYPFGQNADDLTAIPAPAAIDGSVSYYYGWTDPYEYDLLTNPAALPIPRGQMNQLFFDITNNLQEYQQYGTPQWVDSSQPGYPVSYPIYARVYYSGLVYENQVASNTSTPGSDDTWLLLSGNIRGVPTGTVIDFAGTIPPTGYLFCNGSAVSRSSYSDLMSAITQTQSVTTTISANLTVTSAQETMYVGMSIESPNFTSGTTILTINSDTSITLSTTATTAGATTITFFNWGNGDGSTTFNIPDLRRNTTAGSGGSGSTILGNIIGQDGGTETYTLTTNDIPAHTHPADSGNNFIEYSGGSGTNTVSIPPGTLIQFSANTGLNTTTGTAISLIQPTAIMNKCIKT